MTTNAILDLTEAMQMAPNEQSRGDKYDEKNQDLRWQAVLSRDTSHDGHFVFAVSSTGVYCRPSCPSRRPRRANVTFFAQPDQAEKAGYRACLRCRPKAIGGHGATEIAKAICRYIEQHLDEPLTLARLGSEFHQSPFHLQRTFKSVLGITPRAYADSCRMNQLKGNLRAGHSVTRSMYDAGYSSSSRLYERTASQLGMTPDKYRRGAIAAPIRYTFADSPLGRMLIAATDKGICAIQFADSDDELEHGLRHEFPFAIRRRDDEAMRGWREDLLCQMRGQRLNAALPLDIQATAFQRRVWTHLQSIPFGSTRSYAAVAKAIGQPTATRAVARACATNPLAVAIPCHRVVSKSGDTGGYRWGAERKKALLELEAGQAGTD
ncbi:MAG: bifunctional DNA-binding transcriptional regulator/O6-methylguanine-DNA methyltransferase Ada [Terriglobales bacterium]|jgi:AraC family transcriptional regulator, regulatory protein of adaptative response / methylated-DNA-[protein]-cysteine methyltransferase